MAFCSENHYLEGQEIICVVNEAFRDEKATEGSLCHKFHPLLTPVIIHYFLVCAGEEEPFNSVEPGRKQY